MIQTILDLSTAHLSPQTRQALDNEAEPDGPIHDLSYGWLIPVLPGDMQEEMMASIEQGQSACDDLRRVLAFARDLGVDYLKPDADADTLSQLPIYE